MTATCASCGRVLVAKHIGRKRRYCSDRCRDRARQGRAYAFRGTTIGAGSRLPRNVGNLPSISRNCGPDFAGRGSADWRLLWHQIVETEIFAGRDWREVTSRDGVRSLVAVLRQRALREVRP